jgi:AAA+ ATPase superfamily predicted ATPase
LLHNIIRVVNMIPVGNPAVGNDFIDREKEISLILSTLEKDSVLLIAPRRFGKTSIMRKVEKELLGKDEICFFLELEAVNSPHRFISEIVMALILKFSKRKPQTMIMTGSWI